MGGGDRRVHSQQKAQNLTLAKVGVIYYVIFCCDDLNKCKIIFEK